MKEDDKLDLTEIGQRPSITELSQPISRRYKTRSWRGKDSGLSKLSALP